jgi:molybdenum cofactor cytidylyltransferase
VADSPRPTERLRIRPLILAAGSAARFGGGKLSARIDGLPILQHVLEAARDPSLEAPVIVLGPDDPHGIDLGGAAVTRNPNPDRGLASSLRIGWGAAMAATMPLGASDAVLVLLGDQPLVRREVIRILAAQPGDPARPIVAPRYRGTSARNPIRIEAAAAALIAAVEGDRGLGPVLDAHPELVRWIDVDGDNPDVDTAADLAHVADLAWAARVRGNREQVERVREEPDGPDFYARVSSIFREDPNRAGDPVLAALRARARPGDTWIDIGAGAGRYALPLATAVARVIAVDPSGSMLEGLRAGMAEHGIVNVEVHEGRWPEIAERERRLCDALPVDVSLIAHVGYDVEAVWPFIEAMERAATRECVAVLMRRSPASQAEPFWPEIHGEPRISLPALPAFVDLLVAHGRQPAVQLLESSRRRWASRDELEPFVRRQTWVKPGSAKDARLQALLDEWLIQAEDGSWELSIAEPLEVGLVAWVPLSRSR